ncbi:AbiTii domain-containing protein [Arthrobacter mobilis]|uniref:AbiTii domain-containing protein n=1 Tax=Arthrobacter mobilis TaxID=2724944 RepID=A0A7X6HH50_9MICC|nr:hypothetical protein [Arthrobacter mobilis]NKX56280.1 hypothetical protein [Arthrobacter mobilis]
MNHEEQAEALALTKDLLDDIELDRTTLDKQILKASRLARMLNDEQVMDWLRRERNGYYTGDDKTNAYFQRTGRHGADANSNIFDGVLVLQQYMRTHELQLEQLKVPNVSGDYALLSVGKVTDIITNVGRIMQRYSRILSKVSGLLHTFVTTSYLSLRFSTKQDTMFEKAKAEIDAELLRLDETTLRKLDAAYSNLQVGDEESISAAMNSVRRLIVSFADLVFPATEETRPNPGGGNPIKLGSEQWLNRIKAFIDDNAGSSKRQTRLKQAISGISERVSSGVHTDVTKTEAEYLFLSAYILLGEMLNMKKCAQETAVTVTV